MISPAELNTMYRELLNYPAFISELSNYQKSKLWEYAQNMEISELREVNRMMMENPDYPYPNEYRGNGREVEYWMERSNYGRESRFVMELMRGRLNPPQPAASIPVAPSNEPEIVNIEEYLSDKCSLDICDKAAKKIGLSINKSPDTHADLRVHALTTALKDTRSLQTASIGIAHFRPVLASRYGVTDYNPKYRPQHGKGTGPSRRIEKWDEAYNSAFSVLTNHYEQHRRKK